MFICDYVTGRAFNLKTPDHRLFAVGSTKGLRYLKNVIKKCSLNLGLRGKMSIVNTPTYRSKWRLARGVLVVAFSIVIVTMLFRLTEAGPLDPSAPPASTSQSIEDIYQSLVGTFDSSGVVASKSGSALQISKCIILKITGGTPCP